MNLLGELLFAGDHQDPRRFDAGEPQPVPAHDVSSGRITTSPTPASRWIGRRSVRPFELRPDSGPAVRRRGQSIDAGPTANSNQSPREISAALWSISRTIWFWSPLADAATRCTVRSMSTVDRAALKRSSSA